MKNIMLISNGDKSKRQDANNIKMESFYAPCIKALGKENYNIFAGINADIKDTKDCDGVHYFNQNVYRSIFSIKDNWKAYKNINAIIKKYNIDIIHCNSPIGGLLGRICGRKNKVKTVIYTAHGFHFYKGNSAIKNLIFKKIEKHLARYTNAIIVMNNEDYENAKKFKLKNGGKVYKINGIGVNSKEIDNIKVDIKKKKQELGVRDDEFVIVSSGDLIKRKNHSAAIDVVLKLEGINYKYLICGNGPEYDVLKNKIEKNNKKDAIRLLGFRSDVKEILKIADLFLFTSLQEGLPRSLMEAMSAGLPCVVSNVRGNNDLIRNKLGGFCCNSVNDYEKAIKYIHNNKNVKNKMSKYNKNIIKQYDIEVVTGQMKQIYTKEGIIESKKTLL